MPDSITAMERMEYRMRNFRAGSFILHTHAQLLQEQLRLSLFFSLLVIVGLANGEVRVYKDKFLVNTFKMEVSVHENKSAIFVSFLSLPPLSPPLSPPLLSLFVRMLLLVLSLVSLVERRAH